MTDNRQSLIVVPAVFALRTLASGHSLRERRIRTDLSNIEHCCIQCGRPYSEINGDWAHVIETTEVNGQQLDSPHRRTFCSDSCYESFQQD